MHRYTLIHIHVCIILYILACKFFLTQQLSLSRIYLIFFNVCIVFFWIQHSPRDNSPPIFFYHKQCFNKHSFTPFQWYAGKGLTVALSIKRKEKKDYSISSAYFRGVNTPTIGDFKQLLPTENRHRKRCVQAALGSRSRQLWSTTVLYTYFWVFYNTGKQDIKRQLSLCQTGNT